MREHDARIIEFTAEEVREALRAFAYLDPTAQIEVKVDVRPTGAPNGAKLTVHGEKRELVVPAAPVKASA